MCQKAQAQFTFVNNLKGSQPPEIVVGGGEGAQGIAYFTSGGVDPVGAGWLRLNNSVGNQRGYAYVDRSFPSTLGLLVDFEYKMWRNAANDGSGYHGGDGFSVFLFDATVQDFRLGGWGGSLAYAPNTAADPSVPLGLAGGYIGLGFDSYGNYGINSEGKIGEIARDANGDRVPNAVILRGPTTDDDATTTNRYLDGIKLGDNRTGSATDIQLRSEVDYNTAPFNEVRPTDSQFYRRVQVEVKPTTGGVYTITVRWKKSNSTDPFEPLITYTTTDVPPDLLKVGFAASTGGAFNYHEIRNLMVTTPGNLRVNKLANRDVLRTISGQQEITYTVEVDNDTPAAISGVIFNDVLTDANGDMISPSMFQITNISHTGFLSGTTLPSTSETNEISGTLNMAANSKGYITVTGRLHAVPAGNVLINTASALPTDISDPDLENNTASISTPVIAENVDMVISKTVDQNCIIPGGNTFTVTASNMGALPAEYGGVLIEGNNNSRTYRRNRLEITEIVPPGVTMLSSNIPSDWELVDTQPNTPSTGYISYIYQAKFIPPANTSVTSTPNILLGSGMSLPSFTYVLRATGTPVQYENRVRVRFVQESGTVTRSGNNWSFGAPTSITELEPLENRNNNTAAASVHAAPTVPPTVVSTIYYCLGESATPLTANPTDPEYAVRWYSSEQGIPLSNAPTPQTGTAGTTRYYVSQTNGSCEGPKATIDVVVLPTPTAGDISTNETICSGAEASVITSSSAGAAPEWPAGTSVSYQWESSPDGTTGWAVISGATSATYAPGSLTSTQYYRRTTVATVGGKSCYSPPTNTVAKTVNTVDAGVVSGDQTLCADATPTAIGPVTAGSGSGTLTYRWERSVDGASDWIVIDGATAATYNPESATSTAYYRRVVASTLNGVVCEAISNTVLVEVLSVTPGAISGNQVVCNLHPVTVISSVDAGSSIAGAVVSYRWEELSPVSGATWTVVSGADQPTYTPGTKKILGEWKYRRVLIATKNSVSCKVISAEVVVTVKDCTIVSNPMMRNRAR